jgi:hypothetical protein
VAGDVIREIDGSEPKSPEDVAAAVSNAVQRQRREIRLRIMSAQGARYVTLQLR